MKGVGVSVDKLVTRTLKSGTPCDKSYSINVADNRLRFSRPRIRRTPACRSPLPSRS